MVNCSVHFFFFKFFFSVTRSTGEWPEWLYSLYLFGAHFPFQNKLPEFWPTLDGNRNMCLNKNYMFKRKKNVVCHGPSPILLNPLVFHCSLLLKFTYLLPGTDTKMMSCWIILSKSPDLCLFWDSVLMHSGQHTV